MRKQDALFRIMEGTMFASRKDFIASFTELYREGVIVGVERKRFNILSYQLSKPIGYVCRWMKGMDGEVVEVIRLKTDTEYSLTMKEGERVGF